MTTGHVDGQVAKRYPPLVSQPVKLSSERNELTYIHTRMLKASMEVEPHLSCVHAIFFICVAYLSQCNRNPDTFTMPIARFELSKHDSSFMFDGGSSFSRDTSKNHTLQKTITPKTISTVYSASNFSCRKQISDASMRPDNRIDLLLHFSAGVYVDPSHRIVN